MTRITVAKGDGIGPEIMDATISIIQTSGAEIQMDYIDIGEKVYRGGNAAKLADTPECFEVIVMPNLYGDILSDVAAQITGSVGLGGSANIGESCAMFEAIHGSAPMIAGQDVANPSGLIHGAIMMLSHIGQAAAAEKIHNAWLKTIEDGMHTQDIYKQGMNSTLVGTKAFAQAVIANLGLKPSILKPVPYKGSSALVLPNM